LQVALLIISGKKLFKPVLVWALVGAATEEEIGLEQAAGGFVAGTIGGFLANGIGDL
jgi:hypothetical protein